mgnify:CR=1 FL=1
MQALGSGGDILVDWDHSEVEGGGGGGAPYWLVEIPGGGGAAVAVRQGIAMIL